MIITCKKQIPARWIAFTILPWAAVTFNYSVIGAAFIFSLKKFVENPAGVTFILSLPVFFAIIVAPLSSFLSDRIWTRFGRRKPFIITASIGMIIALIAIPMAPNMWALIAAYISYHVCDGIASPRDALKQEVVPPHERGRATGAMTWCQNLANVVFYAVVLGRFDDVRFFAGFPLHGETVIYCSAALLLTVMVLLITLGIKEIDQHSPLRGQRLSVRNIVGGLLDRELWPVYLLVTAYELLNFYSGFGPFLSTLLYTEQWGYTKQEMGNNVAIGGIVNIFLIGLLAFFADRLPRMRAFQTLIVLSLSWNAFYYCYVYFVLPDHRPTLVEIIVFGEVLTIIAILLGLVYIPLTFDYVRRNKMGTFTAGQQIAKRGINLLTLNGVGLFVWGYAMMFQPPAGEMARIVLREPTDQAALVSTLRATTWSHPGDATPMPASAITVLPWQADGMTPETARSWEIRLRDKNSEKIANEKKELEKERSPLLAEAKRLRDDAAAARAVGRIEDAQNAEESAAVKTAESEKLSPRIVAAETELSRRALVLREQISTVLGSRLAIEGEQLLTAKASTALVLELATAERPKPRVLERTLNELRQTFPALIDLRPLKRETGYGLTASAPLEPGVDEKAFAKQIHDAVKAAAAKRAPELFPAENTLLATQHQPALTLEFQVIEQPVVTYVSPVTRMVNVVLDLFDARQTPTYRLDAMARVLRLVEETNHVRVVAGSHDRTIAVTTVLQPAAARATAVSDPLGLRLRTLLRDDSERSDTLLQARALYDRIEKAASAQRITIVRPILTASYAPMRYNYMSGYLWVFFVGFIGLILTIVFSRMEAKANIHKRGVEEAAAS